MSDEFYTKVKEFLFFDEQLVLLGKVSSHALKHISNPFEEGCQKEAVAFINFKSF